MTTIYYDSTYHEVTETELQVLYDDLLDSEGPMDVAGHTIDVSEILKECEPDGYREGLLGYIDALWRDDQLFYDEHEFIDVLLDEWIDDNIPPHDTLDNCTSETLFHAVEELYSRGSVELVGGELTIHPHHTIESLVAYVVDYVGETEQA